MAIASLACSLSGVLCGFSAILGIVFGHIALSQIKRTGQGGRGLAIAGLIAGYIMVAITVVLVIALAATDSGT
jgi:hypothetical protein